MKNTQLHLLFFQALALVCANFAAAQVMPDKVPVIWDGPNVILQVDGGKGAAKSVAIEGMSGGDMVNVKTIALPPEALRRDYFNGALYAFGITLEKDAESKKTKNAAHLLWRQENGKWETDAVLDASFAAVFAILPLGNQKYFVYAAKPFIVDNGGAYLFGIFKKNRNRQLELERPISSAFAKPTWTKTHPQGEYSNTYNIGFGNAVNSIVCRAGDKIVVHLQECGLFFVFSADDGKLLRKAAIFPEINEESLLDGKQHGPVTLGIEPTSDGKIICATLSREFAILSKDVFPDVASGLSMGQSDLDDPEKLSKLVKSFRETEQKRIDRWPDIHWWVFDPETGKVEKMPTPEGFPSKAEDRFIDLNWRIRADGSLALLDDANLIK